VACGRRRRGLRRAFAHPDHRDDGWAQVEVPGHWRSTPELAGTDGPVLHRRRFEATAPTAGDRAWLVLDGLFYQGDVWLDGAYLGDTEGYFVRHSFEVTERAAGRAEHTLAVEVTCARPDDRPAKRNITRRVPALGPAGPGLETRAASGDRSPRAHRSGAGPQPPGDLHRGHRGGRRRCPSGRARQRPGADACRSTPPSGAVDRHVERPVAGGSNFVSGSSVGPTRPVVAPRPRPRHRCTRSPSRSGRTAPAATASPGASGSGPWP
jgi:hypothetical protein